jgi:hypothetical protein
MGTAQQSKLLAVVPPAACENVVDEQVNEEVQAMNGVYRRAFLFFLVGGMVCLWMSTLSAEAQWIRAKLGIQIRSGEYSMRAKTRDQIRTGDLLRVYVHPEKNYFVYVIHSDQQVATLLNSIAQKVTSSTVIMPSAEAYYQVDGKSARESFTIVCSRTELKDLAEFNENGQIPSAQWEEIRREMTEKSRIDLAQQSEKPFPIAGNVRGVDDAIGMDSFVKQLQIYSGDSLLVKTYDFMVQK